MPEERERPESAIEEIVEEARGRLREKKSQSVRRVVKSWLRTAFVENAALKFVAFVLALTVFILVHSEEDVYVGVNVGIQYTLPEDRVLVSEPPETVRITVKGSRRRIRRFDEGDIDRIHIDLRNHHRSEYVFSEDMVQLPEGLELVRFTPPSILTRFEPRVTKDVPVEVQRVGEVPSGYLVTSVTTEPPTATITGAESSVESTASIKTRELSLKSRTEPFRESVELAPPETFVDVLRPAEKKVTVIATIVEEQASRRIGPVNVVIKPGPDVTKEGAARFAVKPGQITVTLRGSRLAVDAVDDSKLEAFVEVSADDVAVGRTRSARVIVPTPAKGIAVEIVPEEVTVGLK